MKQWFQVQMMIQGDVEVILTGGEHSLLQVDPAAPVIVATPDGRMFLSLSPRPWFVPVTQQEASRVLDAQAMEDASERRRSLGGAWPASTIIGLTDLSNGLETS
jgi:hypothetical protein